MTLVGRRKGFTLIGMLIVIIVIAILALLVIPQLLSAGSKAREAELRDDLHQLRNAIQQFKADCGDYPRTLADLMITEKHKGELSSTPGPNGVDYAIGVFAGPYLHTADGKLPRDPFQDPEEQITWNYDPPTGAVHSNSTMTALDGTAYSTW